MEVSSPSSVAPSIPVISCTRPLLSSCTAPGGSWGWRTAWGAMYRSRATASSGKYGCTVGAGEGGNDQSVQHTLAQTVWHTLQDLVAVGSRAVHHPLPDLEHTLQRAPLEGEIIAGHQQAGVPAHNKSAHNFNDTRQKLLRHC